MGSTSKNKSLQVKNRSRHPGGVPVGGQFAKKRTDESESSLGHGVNEKRRGLRAEDRIIEEMGLSPSTREENIRDDIDAWLNSPNSRPIPVSIKSVSSRTFSRNGNLAFELETQDSSGRWSDSWYKKGKAEIYIFDVEGKGVYAISKARLSKHVSSNGFDRVTGNSAAIQQSQVDMGHRHVNAKVGLLNLDKLERLGIAKRWQKKSSPKVA